jgi:superoxide dismutase, Fe-Mn family
MTSSPAASAPYTLPVLPYALDALAPIVSAELMDLHVNKHHASYVKKANELVEQLVVMPVEDPTPLLRALSFHISAHVLHSLFWKSMTPAPTAPSEALSAEINRAFGSAAALRGHLSAAVAKLAGSGWAALVWEPIAGRLVVTQIHDHQHDVIIGATPLLVIDGWEHAYYLDYHSDREGWGRKFFELADWANASSIFESVRNVGTPSALTG